MRLPALLSLAGLAIAPALPGSALAQDFVFEGDLVLENVRVSADESAREPGISSATVTCAVCADDKCDLETAVRSGPGGNVVAVGSQTYYPRNPDESGTFRVEMLARGDAARGRFYACGLTVSGFSPPEGERERPEGFLHVVPGPTARVVFARTQGTPSVLLRGEIR